ncbi:hypothetical protein AB0A74_23855 [Saccharothrix sp. NPDC042600]|uniref:Uncharacterized protein n=1 Tax=Saccharothrix mutabilis subsp. mutabilis TaxID=66855 RepID=A0ABN0U6A1_9PSEU|nr:hypothetical protein GCM10017745_81920 [Saccharothrix mutabilis subsp. capreolus]
MPIIANEIVRSFFFEGAEAPAAGALSVDVLDSWTNTGIAAVRPTTISWSEGQSGSCY